MNTASAFLMGGREGGRSVASDRVALRDRHSPSVPADPSFRALAWRLKFTVRRHKFNKYSLSARDARGTPVTCGQLNKTKRVCVVLSNGCECA